MPTLITNCRVRLVLIYSSLELLQRNSLRDNHILDKFRYKSQWHFPSQNISTSIKLTQSMEQSTLLPREKKLNLWYSLSLLFSFTFDQITSTKVT